MALGRQRQREMPGDPVCGETSNTHQLSPEPSPGERLSIHREEAPGSGSRSGGAWGLGLSWPYPALLTGELCPAAWPASSASALLPAPGGFTEMSLDGGQRLVDETS